MKNNNHLNVIYKLVLLWNSLKNHFHKTSMNVKQINKYILTQKFIKYYILLSQDYNIYMT